MVGSSCSVHLHPCQATRPRREIFAERKECRMKTMGFGHEWRSSCWRTKKRQFVIFTNCLIYMKKEKKKDTFLHAHTTLTGLLISMLTPAILVVKILNGSSGTNIVALSQWEFSHGRASMADVYWFYCVCFFRAAIKGRASAEMQLLYSEINWESPWQH